MHALLWSAYHSMRFSRDILMEVTLEIGMKAHVPMFVKEGESIVRNTDTGAYVERG